MTTRRFPTVGVALGAVVVATTWAYAPSLRGELQFDDRRTITENLALKDLGAFLRDHFLQSFGRDGRPLTDLSFALNYAASGLQVLPMHLTNLAIHLAAVLLAFAFAREVFRRAGAARASGLAAASAALFALHPLQSEAVSYLCQRSEALASALYLATLLALLSSERGSWRWRGALRYLAALALFPLALGAKAIAATVPAAFLLCATCLDPGPLSRRRALRALGLAVPFFLLAAASALFHVEQFHGRADVGFDMARVTPRQYLLTEPRAVLTYLRLALWPAGLSLDHDFPLSNGLDVRTVASLAGLLCVTAVAVALVVVGRRREGSGAATARLAGFGLLWWLLVLLPTSSFIPLADVLVEHRVYLALLGLAIAAVALASAILERMPGRARRWLPAALAAATCACLAMTLEQRNQVWSSQLAVWRDAAGKAPFKPRTHFNYGQALHLAQRDEEAVVEYRRALTLPFDGSFPPYQLRANLATSLLQLGRPAEAIQELEAALALQPGDAHLLNQLAVCAMEQGDPELAMRHAQEALARQPDFGGALNTVGQLRLERGDYGGALERFQAALRQDPDSPPALYNLAHALVLLGRIPEACTALEHYRRVPEAAVEDALQKEQALGCGGR